MAIEYYVSPIDKSLFLGRQGENEARKIVFDLTKWKETYGDGKAYLLHVRPKETTIYPVSVEQTDSQVSWLVTSVDVEKAGEGLCELRYIVDDVIVKSTVYKTNVFRSLEGEVAGQPEPRPSWVDEVLQAVNTAVGDANWCYAELGKDGHLYLVAGDAFDDATFVINSNGDLEVIYE